MCAVNIPNLICDATSDGSLVWGNCTAKRNARFATYSNVVKQHSEFVCHGYCAKAVDATQIRTHADM